MAFGSVLDQPVEDVIEALCCKLGLPDREAGGMTRRPGRKVPVGDVPDG